MPGGSVCKDHTFNKKTPQLTNTARYVHRTNFHSTIQVHEHPKYNTVHIYKYKYMNIKKHKKQKIQEIHRKYEKTWKILIYCPEMNPGRQAIARRYTDPVCKPLLHFHFTSLHSTSLLHCRPRSRCCSA
jgi:hypothetical protein